MPELAEVEYYRKQWDAGVGARVTRVALHAGKRPLRAVDAKTFSDVIPGLRLLGSEARAKQMLFWFGRAQKPQVWLGIHLGMTGRISCEAPAFAPDKHDHLVLWQRDRALVFHDPRMFGRIRFDEGASAPNWWAALPPPVTSAEFTLERLGQAASRRKKTSVKGWLLMQEYFPGIGNWMADEILWRSRIHPKTLVGNLSAKLLACIWREAREVCHVSLETVGVNFSDPPSDWFFHVRWNADGICPRCGLQIETATVGGRTTRWCGRCQRARPPG